MRKYLLELTVFITGAVVMVLELCGSRLMAPFVGVSIVVWTSLIGIVLGSLSLGYYLGGVSADKGYGKRFLSLIIFISSLLIGSILLLKGPVFLFSEALFPDLTSRAVLATLFLFAVPNVLLGMVTPLVTKLKIDSLKTAGGAIGNLYAFSTVGSITGTFLTGFYLLAFFSTTQIILGLSILLALLSLLLSTDFLLKKVMVLIFFVLSITLFQTVTTSPKLLISESRYNHIQIFETIDYQTKKPIKVLNLDNKWDSAMFADGDEELVFDYTKFYRLAKIINPQTKNILMIGGGAYSVPKDYLRSYPNVSVDTVEIDSRLTDIAKVQFNLKDNPRHTIFHEDGRTFLNREAGSRKYDAILMDAFKSYSIPFHLSSLESVQKMAQLLTEQGVVVTNIISSIEGLKGEFLQAEYATYKAVFPNVYLFPVNDPQNGTLTQNIMLVAKKGVELSKEGDLQYFDHLWTGSIPSKPVLTDDFAPVDQYVIKNGI